MKKYKFYTRPCLIQCEIDMESQININSINRIESSSINKRALLLIW